MEDFAPPRFEEFGPLLIAGVGESYSTTTDEASTGIPAQWQRFVPHLGQIPGQRGGMSYGLLFPATEPGYWGYVCAVEVSSFAHLTAEFQQISLARTKYAVFSHRGYLSTLRDTWNHIWNQWLPESGIRISSGARIEKYSETFRPTAAGGIEILIPIRE